MPCCGGTGFVANEVLWPELVEAWGLSADEVRYINRQQGLQCTVCRSSLRSMALAHAIVVLGEGSGSLVHHLSRSPDLRVLEVNPAGDLTQFLRPLAGHVLTEYPDVDMQALPYADATFDLVVHSDTLEHVPDPVRALSECRRVLAPGGATVFTIPVIVGRMSRSRTGLPPSYHLGGEQLEHVRVHTEFGADAWTYLMRAGFSEVRVYSLEYPAGLAFAALG